MEVLAQQILAAIPPAWLGPSVMALGMLYVVGRYILPLRQQLVPPKDAQNGGKDSVHVKLDRIEAHVADQGGRLGRLETRVERLEEPMTQSRTPQDET